MTDRHLLHVPAPGKVNLFLHVVGQRPDGYHLLQSVFMLIDWADTLDFEWRSNSHVSREDGADSAGPALPHNDLVMRAARALQAATGSQQGAHIRLHKRLPQEAGLGGGSSDAASTLLALNQLWQLGLGLPELERIGQPLGADVPFFLHGRNAWVEGIGDQLQAIDLPPMRLLLIKPPEGASTPQIFANPALRRNTNKVKMQDFVAQRDAAQATGETNPAGRSAGMASLMRFGHNDLQPIAQALCPTLSLGLAWMQSQGLEGRMTGSGSALFAWAPHDVDTSHLPPGFTAHPCNNLMKHPLLGWR